MNAFTMDAHVLEGVLYPRQFKQHMSCHTKNLPLLDLDLVSGSDQID